MCIGFLIFDVAAFNITFSINVKFSNKFPISFLL